MVLPVGADFKFILEESAAGQFSELNVQLLSAKHCAEIFRDFTKHRRTASLRMSQSDHRDAIL